MNRNTERSKLNEYVCYLKENELRKLLKHIFAYTLVNVIVYY